MKRRDLGLRFLALLFAAMFVAAWQGLADARLISPVFFPSPARTITALRAMEQRGDLWWPLAATSLRMFSGWILASLAGIFLGIGLARSGPVRAYLEPFLEFLRPLPASAIIPPAILLLGLTSKMAVVVISFGALWPVLLGAYHGFCNVDPQLVEMTTALGMSGRSFLWKVALPSALPDIFAGVRVSLAIALILAIVTEMQAAQPGLGFIILMAQRNFRSAELFAGIVALGILGLITNQALVVGERWLLQWRTPPE